MWWVGVGGREGGVALGSFSSSFIASMLYIRFSCNNKSIGHSNANV